MDKPKGSKIEQELEQYSKIVLQQMVVKKWDDIEAAEHVENDYLVFPERLLKRKKDGSWLEVPCMLHPLRNHEKRKARQAARQMADAEKIDPDKDPDLFADLDTLCILHLAIRNTSPPYEPLFGTPAELERKFDRDTLAHIFGVLDDYTKLLDPRSEALDRDQFLTMIAALVEGRSIRPLRALGGAAQHSFIITMAELLQICLKDKLSPESFEHSMQALSRSKDSDSL